MNTKLSANPDSVEEPGAVFPVIEESVTVYKTVVDNGGVRLRKQVRAQLVEIDEPLAANAVKVTRVPVGRDVDGPVAIRYEDGETIIPVVEERLVVRRQLVLVEEIHIGRMQYIKRIPQSITVRREAIVVERQKPGESEWHLEGETSNSAEPEPVASPSPGDTEFTP